MVAKHAVFALCLLCYVSGFDHEGKTLWILGYMLCAFRKQR